MRGALVGILLVVLLAVAGCGGSSSEASKTATQVLADAVQAAKAASSVHVSGQVTAEGKQTGLDLSIAKGKGATGSMTLSGHVVDLEIVGTEAYMKAGVAFWSQYGGSHGSTIAQMLQNQWLKFPTTNPQFGGITAIADSTTLFNSLTNGHGALTNKGAAMYQGQDVVAIYDTSKSATLYVAATGTPYPIALVKSGSGGGAIAFGSWNKPVTLTPPAGAVDYSQLGG